VIVFGVGGQNQFARDQFVYGVTSVTLTNEKYHTLDTINPKKTGCQSGHNDLHQQGQEFFLTM
jgi:hypothetical protein